MFRLAHGLFLLPCLLLAAGCGGGGGDAVTAPIRLTALSMDTVRVGQAFTIEGSGFGGGTRDELPPAQSRVIFRDGYGREIQATSYQAWADSAVTCTMPFGLDIGSMMEVYVETPTGLGVLRSVPVSATAHRLRLGKACLGSTAANLAGGDLLAMKGLRATWILGVGRSGLITLYDGTSWRSMVSGTRRDLHGVWPVHEGLAFACGEDGLLLRFDGERWDELESPSSDMLTFIGGMSADDLWAGSRKAGLLHWDGVTWTASPLADGLLPVDLCVTKAGGCFLLASQSGGRSVVLRRSGEAWVEHAQLPLPMLYEQPLCLFVLSHSDLWVGQDIRQAFHFDGSTWQPHWLERECQILSIFGTASDDLWASNSLGEIHHWNGTTWTMSKEGDIMLLPDCLWGAASDSIWCSDRISALHWNGLRWERAERPPLPGQAPSDLSTFPSAPFLNAFVTPADEVVVGSHAGRMSRLLDADWSVDDPFEEMPFSEILDLHGCASNELFGATRSSGILRWDGSSWQQSTPSTWTTEAHAVWAFAPDDVWAVTGEEIFCHFDGTAWRAEAHDFIPDFGASMFWDFWGAAPDDLYAAGAWGHVVHWDGSSWSLAYQDPAYLYLMAIDGSAPDNVMACGNPGSILHFDGSSWRKEPTDIAEALLLDICVISPSEAYAVGEGGLCISWDGATWSRLPRFTGENLWKAVHTDRHGLIAVGQNEALAAWNGEAWQRLLPMVHGSAWEQYRSPSGFGLEGCSEGMVRSFDGGAWRYWGFPTMSHHEIVWGRAMTDLVAISCPGIDAADTVIHHRHFDRSSCFFPGLDERLLALDGTAHDDLWACGEGGLLLRFDGTDWQTVPSGTTADLRRLLMVAPDAGWIVGEGGTLLRYDGSSWSALPSGTTTDLNDIFPFGSTEFYLAGDGGVLLRGDGVETHPIALPTSHDLVGVAGHTSSNLFVSAEWVTVLHFDGVNWTVLEEEVPPSNMSPDEVAEIGACYHHGRPFLMDGGEVGFLRSGVEAPLSSYSH